MKVKTGTTRGRRGLNPVSGEVRSAILAVEASHYFNLQYGGLHDVRVYYHIFRMFRGRQWLCNPPSVGLIPFTEPTADTALCA